MGTVLYVSIQRREFLFLGGAAVAGAGLAGCAGAQKGSGSAGGSSPSSSAAVPSPAVRQSRDAGMRLGPQVVHGSRDRAQVALTFHGQGPVSMADALLAEAERAGARVTVLAVGTWLGQYPQIAERILRGGHDLGNHTMHHLDIAAMEASGAYAEIAGCAQRLRALTGSAWPLVPALANAVLDTADRAGGPQGGLPDLRVVRRGLARLHRSWTGRDRIHGARIDAARVDRKPASWALRYRHCVARDFARPGQPGTTPGHPDRPAFPLTAQGRS